MIESAQLTQIQDLSAALTAIVTKVTPSIVSVHSDRSRSSGFVWRPGLIVTADEALSDDGELTVTLPGGDLVGAQLAGRDSTTDVALLRIDHRDLPPVSPAALPVAAGALAMAVGAEDSAPTVTVGVVSRATGPWRSLRGGDIEARIELDLSLRRSAEGGLTLNAAGQAIGMSVFGPRRRVLVIPAATIDRVAAKLETHGRIARGYIGLGLQPVAIEGSGESGAMVITIDPQGPAAAAGLYQGDIIITWNTEPIRHVHALLRALGPDSVGQTVTLGLRRAGETRRVPLTIAERNVA